MRRARSRSASCSGESAKSIRGLPGWPWRARRTSRGARAGSAATTDEVRRAGRAPGVGRRRREKRAAIWQRGCRRAPPDRSPQPPRLPGRPPSVTRCAGGRAPPPRCWSRWPGGRTPTTRRRAGPRRPRRGPKPPRRARRRPPRAPSGRSRASSACSSRRRAARIRAPGPARGSLRAARPALLPVTAGGGLTSAVTGLCVAGLTGSPVVCLAGQHPTTEDQLGSFQEAYGAEICRTFSKFTKRVLDWSTIAADVRLAFREAMSPPPGPTLVEIPTNILYHHDEAAKQHRGARVYAPAELRSAGDPAAVERALEALARAERPLIVAGDGVF